MKDDVTHRAVQKAVARLDRVMDRVAKQIPYGPGKVALTQKEVISRYNKMTPQDRQMFVQMMGGPEFFMEYMNARV